MIFFFGWENQSLLCFFGGGVWHLVTRLKLPNNSTRGVDEVLWARKIGLISRPILKDFFTGWSYFWDLKNDMCRYLSRFFPIKLSALVGQVRFLANLKISRLHCRFCCTLWAKAQVSQCFFCCSPGHLLDLLNTGNYQIQNYAALHIPQSQDGSRNSSYSRFQIDFSEKHQWNDIFQFDVEHFSGSVTSLSYL